MSQMIVTSQDYQRGYDDGLQEGERRGWEAGKEAAAELMHKQTAYPESGDEWEHAAAAIRKLKKP